MIALLDGFDPFRATLPYIAPTYYPGGAQTVTEQLLTEEKPITQYLSQNQPIRTTVSTQRPIKTSLPRTVRKTDWLKWIMIAIIVIAIVFTLWYVFVKRKGKKRRFW